MTAIPAPSIVLSKEEWPDADFDFPDGDSIHASDAEDDKEDAGEDWDAEMDLGKTGGAKAHLVLNDIVARAESSRKTSQMFTIRPPLPTPPDDEDEEGVSTIKVAALPKVSTRPPPPVIDEDFEDDFALPSELTQLSLRPISHRSSKASLEWGDRDQTSSSQSSDAYSTLGFHDNASSIYTSASLPESETEDDEDDEDGELDGLVIPTGLFETETGGKKLAKILETKKKTAFTDERVKIASPDPEDDFEMGLVIDNDVELSPSRLLTSKNTKRVPPGNRSKSAPPRPPPTIRPPSRVKTDRAKSPNNPPISSASQLRKIGTPPSPPSRPGQPVRSQTYSQALASIAPTSPVSFLAPKPGSLRVQKSHSGLKPISPTSAHKLGRKASLPSLSESSHNAEASGSGLGSNAVHAGYNAPTASSRAKTQANSTSRIHGLEYNVPPTRPSTPSANPAALRLTMPTSSLRMKSRTPISSVFPTPTSAVGTRSQSPLPPPRPPSSSSMKSRIGHVQTKSLPLPAPKVMKRPKRQRTYGDGAELDDFEDLPLDRDKEERYRVEPKGYGNRVPGATYAKGVPSNALDSALGKGTLRRKGKRELSSSSYELSKGAPPAKTLKRTNRIDFPTKPEPTSAAALSKHSEELGAKKKKTQSSPSALQTRRKPTLIRNLGGAGGPKVVGEMKWNPSTLRWEGNDQALRDFDSAVGSSTRPALITHLTGSSMGSPVSSFAAGARVVGTMIFDPSRMCWISTLPPDEEEPDVFADLADDEDEDDWEAKGGTIRASQQPSATPSEATRTEPPSPARSHSRTRSGSDSDRCSRASMVCDVDASFADDCRAAQERHRAEMKGWLSLSRTEPNGEPVRSYLYEIRALACRQY
ncbi:hypothetical protein DAEQUDRAFT_681987 [Daedalea quercina L-15889]|uniref:Protein byr4 n=1 Tax=Daedalea quercina L-15889 TaxID=1314783 RepID=A0A165UMZ3_9APHY|nr:hypothetical protein DAEQUDRAFT_681987 [Daedalea quercina L-15889]